MFEQRRLDGAVGGPRTAASAPASAGAASPSAGGGIVGEGEGELNLVAWTQYVMGGSGGEPVPAGGYDWVTPFETATGCKINGEGRGSSSEMVQLMKTGQYDGVSASGDATLRLIAGGDVAAVDTYQDPQLRERLRGPQEPAAQHGRRRPVRRPPRSRREPADVQHDRRARDHRQWSVVFEGGSAYKGKVTAYDYEIYIADAAVYLMAHEPEARHHQPVRPRRHAVQRRPSTCSRQQRENITTYWGTAQQQIDSFTSGDMVVGTTWQYQVGVLGRPPRSRSRPSSPKEGTTGWSDSWMISSKAKHPNCMYKWMD